MTLLTRLFVTASDNMTWVARAVLNLLNNEIFTHFLWGKAWHWLLCILRQPKSSDFLPRGITICFPLLSLLLVVGHGHIHSALDSISVLAAVLLAPKKLISLCIGIVLSGVFEGPFGEAVRFSAGYSLGLLVSVILG